jgi:hypothetical protein
VEHAKNTSANESFSNHDEEQLDVSHKMNFFGTLYYCMDKKCEEIFFEL